MLFHFLDCDEFPRDFWVVQFWTFLQLTIRKQEAITLQINNDNTLLKQKAKSILEFYVY